MRRRGRVLALLLLWGARLASASTEADAVLGEWVMQDGSALLAVEADGGSYRIRLLSVLEPAFTPADGELRGPRLDVHNPDAALRRRAIEGLVLAEDLAYRSGTWEGGIYDPGSGQSYRCRIRIEGDYLRLHGYVGIALLGRTVYWQRASVYARKVASMLDAAR